MADMRASLQTPFFQNSFTQSRRIIHTPSTFARSALIYLQETGKLKALSPHISAREKLSSYLFFIVTNGKGQLKYKGQVYELSQGDCVFIDCSEGYEQKTSGHKNEAGNFDELWSLSWVHFNGASMASIYTKYKERGGQPVFHSVDMNRYADLVQDIFQTASDDSYVRDMHLAGKLTDLLTYLMEDAWTGEDAWTDETADKHTAPKKQLVRQVKDYIDENYKQPLSLQTIAGFFYINKEYLAKLFKETYGYTVNSYISVVRVTKAKEMLRFTDMKVGEIGEAVGIEEVNYFSRVFKKLEGISPKKYRESW